MTHKNVVKVAHLLTYLASMNSVAEDEGMDDVQFDLQHFQVAIDQVAHSVPATANQVVLAARKEDMRSVIGYMLDLEFTPVTGVRYKLYVELTQQHDEDMLMLNSFSMHRAQPLSMSDAMIFHGSRVGGGRRTKVDFHINIDEREGLAFSALINTMLLGMIELAVFDTDATKLIAALRGFYLAL